jgi:hypothetical protein
MGANAQRGEQLSEEQVEQRREMAHALNLAQYLQPGYHGDWWSEEDLGLLGQLPDRQVARRTGRSVNAVRLKREELGIPNPAPFGRAPWTTEEDDLVRTLPAVEVAHRTRRPVSAAYRRRAKLDLLDGRADNGRPRRTR